MHVSPSSDQQRVSIASDAEVQNVIEFLSRSKPYDASDITERDRTKGDHQYTPSYNLMGDGAGYMDGDRQCKPERPNPAHSDNSSSGSSGIGTDDSCGHTSHNTTGSRSTSMSPGNDRKDYESGIGEGLDDEKRYYNVKGSRDSSINLHMQPHKKKGWERDQSPQRISQGLFGPLISSDPGGQNSDPGYGMGVLGLQLLKGMGNDSDSERSG